MKKNEKCKRRQYQREKNKNRWIREIRNEKEIKNNNLVRRWKKIRNMDGKRGKRSKGKEKENNKRSERREVMNEGKKRRKN